MTEKITVKETSIKKGENDKGEWVNTRITTTDGAKWGGFDKNLQYLKEGDVIEITESEQKGKNLNILKWHKAESASPAAGLATTTTATTPPVGKPSEAFTLERLSLESQTAYNGIIELAKTMPSDDHFKKVYNTALDWAEKKLNASMGAMAKAEVVKAEKQAPAKIDKTEPAKSTAEAVENGHFENAGQFAAAAFNEYGLTTSKLCEKFGVYAIKDIADLDAAWKDLKPAK